MNQYQQCMCAYVSSLRGLLCPNILGVWHQPSAFVQACVSDPAYTGVCPCWWGFNMVKIAPTIGDYIMLLSAPVESCMSCRGFHSNEGLVAGPSSQDAVTCDIFLVLPYHPQTSCSSGTDRCFGRHRAPLNRSFKGMHAAALNKSRL